MGIWKEGIKRSKTNKPRKEDLYDIKLTVNVQDFTGYDLTMDREVRKPKK